MSFSESTQNADNTNGRLERVWSGLGWGLLLVLIGVLVLADNQGWLQGGEGWLYFAIGLGALFIIGFLVRCLGNTRNIWSSFGGLVAGLALVYVGAAFLYGFGNWWPVVFILIGVGYLAKAVWHHKSYDVP
jgi:hypothetical protein